MVLSQFNQVSKEYGLDEFDTDTAEPEQMREYFKERKTILEGLSTILKKAAQSGTGEVKNLVSKQLEHLIISLQAGHKEAFVYGSLTPEKAKEGLKTLNAMYESWKLPVWKGYDKYVDDLPAFFKNRSMVIVSILEAINQPYPGYGPEDVQRTVEAT
jgi:hypothetical protein